MPSQARRTLAALVAAGVLAGCAPATTPGAADDLPTEVAAPTTAAPRPDRARSDDPAPSTGAGHAVPAPPAGTTAATPTPHTTAAGHRSADTARATAASSSCVRDRASDREGQGDSPAYADLVQACVREDGEALILSATAAAALPSKAPDRDTAFGLGFVLRGGDTETFVQAELGDAGWTVHLTRGDGRRTLPGAAAGSGSTLRITLAAAEVPGAALRWSGETSWSRSTVLSTAYAFDAAPDRGEATLSR